MRLPDKNPVSLFNSLEAEDWLWENGRLYGPNKTFWIEGTIEQRIPRPMLVNMYGEMKVTLEKLVENRPSRLNTQQHQDWISDMESLAHTLKELVEENQDA